MSWFCFSSSFRRREGNARDGRRELTLDARRDEFDVTVGDSAFFCRPHHLALYPSPLSSAVANPPLPSAETAFVIISKTKGWWVVHRDLPSTSSSSLDSSTPTPRKSAWVPAGCLLETSVPPLSLAPPSLDLGALPPGNAATVPIEPQFVVSVSTPNVALMDYEKVGSDELEVRKGVGLRILKRYNHCELVD